MFWKIFSGVWLCSWKYRRKHIFYLLLTFSQLPNKYIISFLNTETQKKENQKKKIHQIRSNWEKKEERSVWCYNRRGVIGSVYGRRIGAQSEECAAMVVGLELGLRIGLSLSLSLSLSLCTWVRKWFEVKIFTSNHFRVKAFKTRSNENNFRKIYFPCATKHAHLRKSIFGSDLKPKQTQPK